MTRPDERPPEPPAHRDGPVFAEPWQAQAFALALELHRSGHFTWTQWAAALGAEIAAAGDADDGSDYYRHWLAALERLVADTGAVTPAALAERKRAWAEAYARTPHGKPVTLEDNPRSRDG